MLNQITKGRVKRPDFFLLYGVDGIGKTTMLAQMPKVVFVGPERGSDQIDHVSRFPVPKDFTELYHQLQSLLGDHEFQSVAIDSLDHIEPLIWDAVVKVNGVRSIEDVGGGFGKGYVAALKEWQKLMALLEMLRNQRNLNIGAIAHSQVKAFTDPQTGTAYDRYMLKMNEKASALVREKFDSVLFANFKVFTRGKEGQKHVAFGDGKRVMYTERRPAFDAKNRFALPFEMSLSYSEYKAATEIDLQDKIKEVLEQIRKMKALVLPEIQKKIEDTLQSSSDNFERLIAIKERLITLVAEKE